MTVTASTSSPSQVVILNAGVHPGPCDLDPAASVAQAGGSCSESKRRGASQTLKKKGERSNTKELRVSATDGLIIRS